MSPASGDSRRSWRGAPRGTLVRRSRNVWRYLLTAIAALLIGTALYLAWPSTPTRTVLLILSAEREERTEPLVPYVAGDRRALLDWAVAAAGKIHVQIPAQERRPSDRLRQGARAGPGRF
jgi:hypothetical protein